VAREARTLVVPTLLAVTVLAAAGCPGDDRTTMTAAGDAGSTAVTAAPTEGGATSSASGTGDGTGGLPDCEAVGGDMAACQATAGCAWDAVLMACVVDCEPLAVEATCLGTRYCQWFDGDCFPPL
jgi:hypothetical protein